MTSAQLQRDLRAFAEQELDLTWRGTELGGRHIICLFETAGRVIRFPVPQGTISEGGPILRNLKRNLKSAVAEVMR